MTTLSLRKEKILTNSYVDLLLKSFAGCIFLIACSFIKVPFYPVSFTMQTFAICLLGLTFHKNASALSVIFYLILASVGAPVLCGKVAPLWFVERLAGYYLAMPIACYLIGSMKSKPTLALILSTVFILSFGAFVLSFFIGFKSAFIFGFLMFLPTDLLKAFSAAFIGKKVFKKAFKS